MQIPVRTRRWRIPQAQSKKKLKAQGAEGNEKKGKTGKSLMMKKHKNEEKKKKKKRRGKWS